MDWPTTVGVTGSIGILAVAVILLVRWGIAQNDSATLAKDAQREQLANQHEAERQRDAAIAAHAKAEGDLALATADNAKLHAVITQLITTSQTAVKEKIDAATGDDLVALGRAVLGVPQLPNVPAAGDPGSTAAGSGPARPTAVRGPGGA